MAHTVIGAQPDKAAQIDAELRHVFPQAETWTFEDRESPHFRGYVGVGEERVEERMAEARQSLEYGGAERALDRLANEERRGTADATDP